MSIQLCVFDLDGTLVDSLEDLRDSINFVLRKFGFREYQTEEYKKFIGNGILKLIEYVIPPSEFNRQLQQEFLQEFNIYYAKHCTEKTVCFDGILELLQTLHNQGIQCAVLSNKPDEFTKQVVQELIKFPFQCVVGKQDGYEKKPNPLALLEIIHKRKLLPENCVMIGDSDVDINTAKNAGICSVGVTWGFRSLEELQQAKADYIIDKPIELLDCISELK